LRLPRLCKDRSPLVARKAWQHPESFGRRNWIIQPSVVRWRAKSFTLTNCLENRMLFIHFLSKNL
jgi:hypothetical protein